MTMVEAAADVLSAATAPMHYRAIWAEMVMRGHKSNGLTPWHTVRVLMSRRPDLFEILF